MTDATKKMISMAEAVAMVKSHEVIGMSIAGGEPSGLLTELATQKDRLEDVTLMTCLPMRAYDIFAKQEMVGHFFNDNWFYSAIDRKVHPWGGVSYSPNNLHRAAEDKMIALDNHINVFWGTATPPNEDGTMSMSLGLVVEKELMQAADLVIFEVNENLPYTYGDTEISVDDVDYLVENHVPLVQSPPIEPSEIEKAIGGFIAPFVEDESTLQLGIGGIPNAIAAYLKDRKNLGVHTELLVDGMVDLYEAGVVTNAKKTLHPGKFVATFALGTQKLYDFMDHNKDVMIKRGRYVNDPYVIAQNKKMVSVNSAIQVDIYGQVCAQSLGTRHFSGTGGQLDTHRGAQLSEGGKGIITLRSTAKRGTISTIVPTLTPGSEVTVPSQDVDTIVTEYGVAELRGRNLKQRMKALVEIAHPDFREWIEEEASRLGIVPKTHF